MERCNNSNVRYFTVLKCPFLSWSTGSIMFFATAPLYKQAVALQIVPISLRLLSSLSSSPLLLVSLCVVWELQYKLWVVSTVWFLMDSYILYNNCSSSSSPYTIISTSTKHIEILSLYDYNLHLSSIAFDSKLILLYHYNLYLSSIKFNLFLSFLNYFRLLQNIYLRVFIYIINTINLTCQFDFSQNLDLFQSQMIFYRNFCFLFLIIDEEMWHQFFW